MGSYSRPGRKIRIALLIAFGGLLALSLAAGLEALSDLKAIHAGEQQVRSAFLARNRSLVAVRTDLDTYGTQMQAWCLNNSAAQPSPAAGLFEVLLRIRTSFRAYPNGREPAEQALLTAAGVLLDDQEAAMTKVVAASSSSDQTARDQTLITRYIREQMLPGHARLIETTSKIAVWDNRHFSEMDAALLDRFATLRTRLTRWLTVTFGSGLLLALGSIVYILGQEKEARQRYEQLEESRREMSNLSARLQDAQEQERRAISRELHDEVGQSLGAMLVDVGRLASSLPEQNKPALDRIKTAAERSVEAVRNMALLLRPSMLDDLGLLPALEWQAREVSRRSELEVEVDSGDLPADLSEETKTCIYRIAQEALNNAARHSGGHNAKVDIRRKLGSIFLFINDDGHGFDPARTRGLGLVGMEERVRRLGGSFSVESKPGSGTTISVSLPVQPGQGI